MIGNGRGTLLDAFRFAGRGVLEAAVFQRNMRLHLIAAVLVAAFAGAFPLGTAEQLALLACTFLVPAGEVLNAALEAAVDLAAPGPDERARRAKDAAAGSVLVLAVGAAAVFALVVARNWEMLRTHWREGAAALALGFALAALSASLVFPFARPRWLDRLASLGGALLLLPLALVSKNPVFTGVAGLALAVCALAAFARRSRAAEEAARDPRGASRDDPPALFGVREAYDDGRPGAISPAAPPPRRPAR